MSIRHLRLENLSIFASLFIYLRYYATRARSRNKSRAFLRSAKTPPLGGVFAGAVNMVNGLRNGWS